jgi:hypothetical protein
MDIVAVEPPHGMYRRHTIGCVIPCRTQEWHHGPTEQRHDTATGDMPLPNETIQDRSTGTNPNERTDLHPRVECLSIFDEDPEAHDSDANSIALRNDFHIDTKGERLVEEKTLTHIYIGQRSDIHNFRLDADQNGTMGQASLPLTAPLYRRTMSLWWRNPSFA